MSSPILILTQWDQVVSEMRNNNFDFDIVESNKIQLITTPTLMKIVGEDYVYITVQIKDIIKTPFENDLFIDNRRFIESTGNEIEVSGVTAYWEDDEGNKTIRGPIDKRIVKILTSKLVQNAA